jgi:cytochrome c556
MLKHLIVLSGALIGLAAVGLPQQDTPGVSGLDAIAARQASLDMSSIIFHSMGDAMKAGREAESQGYPAAALAKWARALPRMFPPGTGQGDTSAFSQALPAIWKDRAGFDQAAANDTAGFTKQLEEVNQACGACHARYKAGAQGPPRK